MIKQIAILGSTGSIGTQTLEVIASQKEMFQVYALTALRNVDLLIRQARRFMPDVVVIGDELEYNRLKSELEDLPIKVYAGADAINQVVTAEPIDMVVTAMVGYAGLAPTIAAIKAGKAVALANKETLVVAGELISRLAIENNAPIIPVDSEHSAIFQCLTGELHNGIEKIILTASGGPFRTFSKDQMRTITKKQALKHPNWVMGEKVTIDSATMMNKGLEVIEARWLFDLKPNQIEVVVHPQSIVHSMVQFNDGAIKAQMGLPDMRLPIAYALAYPRRINFTSDRMSVSDYFNLTFEKPDLDRFPALGLAFQAMRQEGNMPCIMNAANEVAVQAFLNESISFLGIPNLVEQVMQQAHFITHPTYDDYIQTDRHARELAINHLSSTK